MVGREGCMPLVQLRRHLLGRIDDSGCRPGAGFISHRGDYICYLGRGCPGYPIRLLVSLPWTRPTRGMHYPPGFIGPAGVGTVDN